MAWADWKSGILMSPGLGDHQTLLLCASGAYQTPHRAPEPVLVSGDPGACASLGQKLCHAQGGRERGSLAPGGASGEARAQVVLAVPGMQAFLCPSHSGAASLTLCQQTNDIKGKHPTYLSPLPVTYSVFLGRRPCPGSPGYKSVR